MIISIEGPRGAGKTFLLSKFFEQNKDPRFEYYKWYLVDWIKELELESKERSKDVHYMSIGNILTILDIMKTDKNKILVFDRALITAYSWAILRKRLSQSQAIQELGKILKSQSYTNIKTVFIDPNPAHIKSSREKDMWDKKVKPKHELMVADMLTLEHRPLLSDLTKGNSFTRINNEFNETSCESFIGHMNGYSELINT